MNDDTILCGSVSNIIYRNEENGYTIFEVEDSENIKITCTAKLPSIENGENVRLVGNFVIHETYGSQFAARLIELSPPSNLPNIEKYLASSIKGIGERTAKRITEMFGDETFNIIENFPFQLAKVKGIPYKRAKEISEIFKEKSSERHIKMYLMGLGITPAVLAKIYKEYKDKTIDVVKNNPYILAEDIYGVGFKTADAIARSVGIEPHSEDRISAGVLYVLYEGAANGHVYLEKTELLESAAALLSVEIEPINNILHNMQFLQKIVQDNINGSTAVYLHKYFRQENYVARKLLELSAGAENVANKAGDEIDIGFPLADSQKQAVRAALSSGCLVITGGPGTGKTTIINALIKLFINMKQKIELAAPTGRAAKRMEEASGHEAKTIHRLLGIGGEMARIEKTEKNPIEADVVIIDESSMVDITLMHHLLRAIPAGTRLILVGDADQLPSIGPGLVLKDIISAGCIDVVRLTQIFRQAEGSAIVLNAHRINHGTRPVLNEKGRGFYYIAAPNVMEIRKTLIGLVKDRLPKYIAANPITEIQVLTPMRKSALGVIELNHLLQNALNPTSFGQSEIEAGGYVFRVGDKVMQVKNNYDLAWQIGDGIEGSGVYNGDVGRIININEGLRLCQVLFEGGRRVDYDSGRLDELTLAYAATIHKSQGSEYKAVIIPLLTGPPMLLTRNLLYTAVTRAKELVVIVGAKETMYSMVNNNRELKRFSALDYWISKIDAMGGGPPQSGFIRSSREVQRREARPDGDTDGE